LKKEKNSQQTTKELNKTPRNRNLELIKKRLDALKKNSRKNTLCGSGMTTERTVKNTPKTADTTKSKKKQKIESIRVDVAISPVKTEQIIVKKGDDVKVLADRFARKYKLNRDMREKLTSLLSCKLREIMLSSPTP